MINVQLKDLWIMLGLMIALWGTGVWVGFEQGKYGAKRQTEELFLKNSTLSLGEVAMCLDVIYRSEK